MKTDTGQTTDANRCPNCGHDYGHHLLASRSPTGVLCSARPFDADFSSCACQWRLSSTDNQWHGPSNYDIERHKREPWVGRWFINVATKRTWLVVGVVRLWPDDVPLIAYRVFEDGTYHAGRAVDFERDMDAGRLFETSSPAL